MQYALHMAALITQKHLQFNKVTPLLCREKSTQKQNLDPTTLAYLMLLQCTDVSENQRQRIPTVESSPEIPHFSCAGTEELKPTNNHKSKQTKKPHSQDTQKHHITKPIELPPSITS